MIDRVSTFVDASPFAAFSAIFVLSDDLKGSDINAVKFFLDGRFYSGLGRLTKENEAAYEMCMPMAGGDQNFISQSLLISTSTTIFTERCQSDPTMTDVKLDYISVGGNRHPTSADWDTQSGVLAFGADNNIALWNPLVCIFGRLLQLRLIYSPGQPS